MQYGGQNGLLDAIAHPEFAKNRLVYISYVEPGPICTSGLAVRYGCYVNNAIQSFRVISRDPAKTSDRAIPGILEADQGPDGATWVLEDGGSSRLLKLTPKS